MGTTTGTTTLAVILAEEVAAVTIMKVVRMARAQGIVDLGDLGDLGALPAAADGGPIVAIGVVEVTGGTLIPSSSTRRWISSRPMMRTPSPSNCPA